MQHVHHRLISTGLRGAVLAAALLTGAVGITQAQTSKAYLTSPSVARVAVESSFNGGRFAPNLAVTVMVRAPGGQDAGYSAVTTADGSLNQRYAPTAPGKHTVRVTDSSGKLLARSEFIAVP